MASDNPPQPYQVPKVGDNNWEVLIATENTWLSCETEHDARVIANARVLEYESEERMGTGPRLASELEKLADMLTKYRIGFGSRHFRRLAEKARGNG